MADTLIIKIQNETIQSNQSPAPGTEQNYGALAGAASTPGLGGVRGNVDPRVSSAMVEQIMKNQGQLGMVESIGDTRKKASGFFRNTYTTSYVADGEIENVDSTGSLFEKGTTGVKSAASLGMIAARQTIDNVVSYQKYTSGSSAANHRLDNNMKLANYAASIGIATAINPAMGAVMAAGIVITEIGGAIKDNREFKYDQRMAGYRQESIALAVGNLTYGRARD